MQKNGSSAALWMIFTGLFLSASLSCMNTPTGATRTPQQVNGPQNLAGEETEEQLQEAEQMALQEALQDTGPEPILQQQLEIHSLSQSLVEEFDAELEQAYQAKIKNPKSEIDLSRLAKKQVELQAAWQFSEKNYQKIQTVYSRLVEESNDPKSPIQNNASESLNRVQRFLQKNWQQKNQLAVSGLAHELESVNERIRAQKQNSKILNLKSYLKVASPTYEKKWQDQIRPSDRLQNEFQIFRDRHWQNYNVERQSETQNRVPQADSIYPDPGPAGTVNGSHFPSGLWALTFDDGPHPTFTQGMIDALQAGHMQGTFFWLSQNLKLYPKIVAIPPTVAFRRGSHSYTHANLPKLGEAGLKHEIDDAGDVFTSIVGDRATFFRCPYGACGPNGSAIRQHIANRKMIHVSWNVDSLDWQDKNPASIFSRVKKQMDVAGHGIVLFHDIHPQSVEAIKLVVAYIQTKPDWKVKTMDKIIQDLTGKEYPSP